MTSAEGFANAFIERIEDGFRANDGPYPVVNAQDNAAVEPVMNTIPWFQHRAVTRQGGVHAYETEFRTEVARGLGIQARHLAGILLALDEGDDIVAGRNKGVGIFEGAADLVAIDGQRTVSVLTTSFVFCTISLHKTASSMIQTGGCQYTGGSCEDPQEGRSVGAR